MPVPVRRRATPGGVPSPATAREPPRLRPALGGGRGSSDPAHAAATSRELWLAIHLPGYVLESLRWRAALTGAATAHPARGTAVVDAEDRGQVVCACDVAAATAGVTPGMALNSALALLPSLHVLPRDVAGERALLGAVATLAIDFTPRVALEPPDAVLLEVRGSLRLFGGVRRLLAGVRERLQRLGIVPRLALTPTPLAALWFARVGEEVALRRREGLASRLAPLPLACTRWPEKSVQSLATMGVRTVGDCLRLPRDGFARRFAPELLLALDRALGRVPDPRAAFVPRPRFAARRDLEPELSDTARLGLAVEPLLEELCAFLRLRGHGVDALELTLLHREAPATRVRLRLVAPATQAAHIASLLREHLERQELPEPVRALRLRSGPSVPVAAMDGDLFARHAQRTAGVPQLIERLRARLGADAVHGLRLVAEHRPERNWGHSPISASQRPMLKMADQKLGNVPYFHRPLWLLAEPLPLPGGERPRYGGPLELEEGPERIESGWWDGHDVRRDYYVARDRAGARLWVFRERQDGGRWFLHGVFG
jgi:protein ImuB